MSDAQIRIRVGASVDGTIDQVFSTIEARAKKSAKRVAASMKKAGKSIGAGLKQNGGAGGFSASGFGGGGRGGNPYRTTADEAEKSSKRRTRAEQKASRETIRGFREIGRVAEQEINRRARAHRRAGEAAAKESRLAGRRFARRTSYRAARSFGRASSLVGRGTRDVLRGTGVRTDLAGITSSIVEQEKTAQALSIQAFRPGEKGAAGIRQDPGTIVKEARKVAGETGSDTGEILGGLAKFTAQSGDLEAARASMSDIVKLARSQGVEMEAVFFAAAKINSALMEQPDLAADNEKRQKKVLEIMKLQVAQGKIGSIEFKEFAKELPKLSGLTGFFGGDIADAFKNIQAVAQVAEGTAAKNTAVATTATGALTQDLLGKRAQKRFNKKGISVKDKAGDLRSLEDIIVDTLRATEGPDQLAQLSELLPNKRARLPVQSFASKFRKAGGGEKGEAAVRGIFGKFSKTIGDKQLKADLAAVQNTTEAKAKKFNVELEKVAASVSSTLLPALQDLGPSAISLAKTLGDVATFTAKNPKTAIALGLTASIAKGGVEAAFRAGVERLFLGSRGGAAGGPGSLTDGGGGRGKATRASRLGGAASKAGSALVGLAIAATAVAASIKLIDTAIDESRKADNKKVDDAASLSNVEAQLERAERTGKGLDKGKALGFLGQRQGELRNRIERGQRTKGASPFEIATQALTRGESAGVVRQGLSDAGNIKGLQAELAALKAIMSRTQNVRITNASEINKAGPAAAPGASSDVPPP